MAKCLQDFHDTQLSELNTQLDPSEHDCLQSLLGSINTALARYHEWLARQNPA